MNLKNVLDKLKISCQENIVAEIKSIDYIEKTGEVFVKIDMKKEIPDEIKDSFKQKLAAYLGDIDLNISYNLKENPFSTEDELIKSEIVKYNPSVKAWVDKLQINLDKEENKIEIIAPTREIHNSFSNNGLHNILEEKLKVFGRYGIFFICKEEEVKKDELIENIEKEEDHLCSNTNTCKVTSPNIGPAKNDSDKEYIYKSGRFTYKDPVKIADINLNDQNVSLICDIFKLEVKELKNSILATIYITDYTNSLLAKAFLKDKEVEDFKNAFKEGTSVMVGGQLIYDNYAKSQTLMIRFMQKTIKEEKKDEAKEKRIELRLHTKMSQMNGVTSFSDFAKRAAIWGHEAIAITDLADVQGFPEAMEAASKYNLKVIYGLDANFVDDEENIVYDYENPEGHNDFVVFDIETTGLSTLRDKITEIGAVKVSKGIIVDRYSQLINPEIPIPEVVSRLTGITNSFVENEPTIEEAIGDFYKFIKGSVLVAHNAKFDTAFIRRIFKENNLVFDFPILDTLTLARASVFDVKKFNLSALCKRFGIRLVGAHRAVNDAEATANLFLTLVDRVSDKKNINFDKLNELKKDIDPGILFETHLSILCKDLVGLKNLYKLVSKSHLNYYSRCAKVPRSLIEEFREGLLIGSGDGSGEIFDAFFRNLDFNEVEEIAKFYDYLEIQPINNYIPDFLNNRLSPDDVKEINLKIYELGKKMGLPVVATGDVFYLDEKDDLIRRIILNGKTGKPSSLVKIKQKLFFRTTDEMLEEFSYMGPEIAREVVIENPKYINSLIDEIQPIPEGKYPPEIEGSDDDLRTITYKRAIEIYGDPLPEIVEKRLKRELDSIISNGYAVLYIIAQKLVKKSNDDGYLVGSRGSVGSSFVATMAGITEVNPLPVHYICKNCKHSEFINDPKIGSGVDLPDKNCPNCDQKMDKDGHNIPFEVFLGFNGDKEPDIDLNFAGEYQPNAHKYTEELFGKGYVFRAGTIGTVAFKTAYGFVKKFFEERGLEISQAEVERLTMEAMGVKRTSGQHPGGVMICPKTKDIFNFTPIQYPADDKNSGVITTHFDYNFIHGKILKLDILGHDGPTILKMLEDFTGVDSSKVPLDDKETISLFSTSDNLKLDKNIMTSPTGTLGIPEFGTDFVRQMLIATKPNSFAELVRISGLSHGTDVWTGNAQELVANGRATLSEVICTREDIMLYLIDAGAENKMAFDTMEKVRKGKGLTDEQIEIMNKLNLPPWYIDSCQKIKYMFPKAHAVAYVMLSFRIAYYKLNYPLAFYATYFTIKLENFNGKEIIKGHQEILQLMEDLKTRESLTVKEKNEMTVYEVALEMYARGFEFLPCDLYKSEASKFTIEDGKIRMPLRALMGVGEQAANSIVEERQKGKFLSKQDLKNRAKVGPSLLSLFEENKVIGELDDTNQISMFGMF
ncbi:PolC-type DNA polymerase III [uncultured Peptoniphilus sp.]|uniref:PolC-type DNA polymerase III n=1 Tax=uncultured Peptoniphilus sp. TaxID=254354 RepID=UPI0028039AB5|nr:PolC-type DNA polymerase III [uncultured Peptoniphilus sp.]